MLPFPPPPPPATPGLIVNFRNLKSLHMMDEDITVLRQLLSNTALAFRNQTALPTHCSEMYVISR